MRIAIDARKLRDFGIGTYLRNILIELSRLDRETYVYHLLEEVLRIYRCPWSLHANALRAAGVEGPN